MVTLLHCNIISSITNVLNFANDTKSSPRILPPPPKEASFLLGPVRCLEWSYGDASVIAVSWKSGGLSLWSVFGSLLLCSLGDQPG